MREGEERISEVNYDGLSLTRHDLTVRKKKKKTKLLELYFFLVYFHDLKRGGQKINIYLLYKKL